MPPKRSASVKKTANGNGANVARSRSSSRGAAATPAKADKVYGGITHSGAEDYEFGGPIGCFALMLWSHYILFYFWFVTLYSPTFTFPVLFADCFIPPQLHLWHTGTAGLSTKASSN
jgi:hypothetical protein